MEARNTASRQPKMQHRNTGVPQSRNTAVDSAQLTQSTALNRQPVGSSGFGSDFGSGLGFGSGSGSGSGSGEAPARLGSNNPVESMAQVMPSQVDSDDEAFVGSRQKRCKLTEVEAEEQVLAISRVDRAIKRAAADECGRRISAMFRAAATEAAGEAAGEAARAAAGPYGINPRTKKPYLATYVARHGVEPHASKMTGNHSQQAGRAGGQGPAGMSPAQAAEPECEPCGHPMLICCRGFRLHWDKSYVPHCGGCDQLVHVSHLSFCPDVCGCDDYTEVHGSDNENCQYCQFGASE